MEISQVSSQYAGAPAGAATEKEKVEVKTTARPSTTREDRIELSKQAIAYINQMQEAQSQPGQAEEKSWVEDMLENSNQQVEAAAEGFQVEARCQRIAANILSGKRVPIKDQQYLMEKSPELYKMAMLMKKTKKDPEECKSVLGDEEETQEAAETTGGETESSAPEAVEVAEGGEETATE